MPSSPACTMTSSPRSKRTSERLSASRRRRRIRPSDRFGRHRKRPGRVAELAAPGEHIGESMTCGLDRQCLPAAGSYGHVEVNRIGSNPIHRPGLPPEASADNANVSAVIVFELRNVRRFHLLITRSSHLQRRWKVAPKLESVHPAGMITFRHLLMDDAASSGHPLDVASGDSTPVSHTVAVLHRSSENVCDRLDAAVGMPGKARR